MPFTTPDLADENPALRALAPILKNLGGRKTFWGQIETLECPDDNSFVKEQLNSEGNGKILIVDAKGISSVALLGGCPISAHRMHFHLRALRNTSPCDYGILCNLHNAIETP